MGSASCTSSSIQQQTSVGGNIFKGKINDIDEVALNAITNGIGQQNKAALKQRLRLSFSLRDLQNLDTFSKTDSFLIIFEMKS